MKEFKLLFFIATIVLFAGCKKPLENDLPLPNKAVTYTTISGAWELMEWNGEALAENTCLYIEFNGREHRFDMWDNIGSMYVQHRSGTFTISQDESERYILSGQYDFGIGDWNNNYEVKMLAEGEKMVWYAEEENSVFSRTDAIPEFN